MNNPLEASLSMAGVTGLTFLVLSKLSGVGPLLVLVRGLHRISAACECLGLCWRAAVDEWRRMWPSCLARAQRKR